MSEEPSEKKRKLNEDLELTDQPGSWIFVGNLPPGSISYDHSDLEQWFIYKISLLLRTEDKSIPEDSIVLAVTNFNIEEGYALLKLHSYEVALLSLKISGTTFKGSLLSVTLVQCLPDAVYLNFPLVSPNLPPNPDKYLDKWRGKYIVFSDLPHTTTEYDIRSLFEALGGPLESLFLFTEDGFFKGCGRLSLVNSLVNESVVQRLNNAPVDKVVLRIASLLPDNRPKPANAQSSLLAAREAKPVLSVSAQVLMDPVIGVQMRSGRQMGAVPSRVVQLLNIVKLEDLLCEKMHEELIDDVRREASQYGKLESVIAPTPVNRMGPLPVDTGCAKIFLEFSDTTSARKAQFELNGRLFDNRVVCAAFYPLKPFLLKQYDLMVP
eukprot:Protomagalhaensia_wolfi_Nauph_80__1363@NODE_1814_length_1323_cov_17_170561_g1416_i0_p1_GENE_NODE_1814_length_1323_cov_17_170561_g1416_i0NODE_1814_length_1323_cov_17_170561_g1416_i0_p1_ORF_typecomplete_len380_score58_75RRM_1/PF00076_22/23RRM_1/PF00076_22/0_032RRM_1/PF00076_22/0_00052RRM_occluded/PF16842_5/6_9e02RRM_occluded/PF16842_5/7_1RRM_occluded/PF16842_5/0_37_NODE_1814_length_1323_cov_17_170561_g1416_i01541293